MLALLQTRPNISLTASSSTATFAPMKTRRTGSQKRETRIVLESGIDVNDVKDGRNQILSVCVTQDERFIYQYSSFIFLRGKQK